MTQCDRILQHMKRKPITALEALDQYGCFRLAARIKDLRDSGYKIETTIIERGEKRYAQYMLNA